MDCQTEELLSADPDTLARAGEIITQGNVAVIPTETVYGLTAAADNVAAVQQVFELKRRSVDKPSAIFLAEIAEIDHYAELSTLARRIVAEFLPGPLTVVLQSKLSNWPGVVSDTGKIGIRISADGFIGDLVRQCRSPLLATSAGTGRSGDLKSLAEVRALYANIVPLIVYKDKASPANASTVVDLSGARPLVLRQGELELPQWCFTGEED